MVNRFVYSVGIRPTARPSFVRTMTVSKQTRGAACPKAQMIRHRNFDSFAHVWRLTNLDSFRPAHTQINCIHTFVLNLLFSLSPNLFCLLSTDAWTKKKTVIFRVYCADHTYCTLRFAMNTTAEVIKACAADKLQLNRANEDLVLVEVKSNGERTVYKDHDVSIPTALCLNGRIFVSPKDHIDALVSTSEPELFLFRLKNYTNDFGHNNSWIQFVVWFVLWSTVFALQTPLPEQEGSTDGIEMDLEALGTKELAFHITLFDWDLFWAVHEYELLYHTFGRHHFGKVSTEHCTSKS